MIREHITMFLFKDVSTSVCRDSFSVSVQSIAVMGNINNSVAVNFEVGKFVFMPACSFICL